MASAVGLLHSNMPSLPALLASLSCVYLELTVFFSSWTGHSWKPPSPLISILPFIYNRLSQSPFRFLPSLVTPVLPATGCLPSLNNAWALPF